MKKTLINGLWFALVTTAYISLVALFFQNAEKMLGKIDHTILAPMTMLTLLVISAAITGSLVLGKPVMLYIDGAKKEAVKQLAATVGWLAAMLAILVVVLAIVNVK